MSNNNHSPGGTRSGRAAAIFGAIASLWFLSASVAPASARDRVPSGTLGERIASIDRSIEEGDFERALTLSGDLVDERPGSAPARFAHARALAGSASVGHDAVLDSVLEAVRVGWTNFHALDHDPVFERFRGSESYEKFVLAWGVFIDERARADLGSARDRLGDGYEHFRHEALRLNILSAVAGESLAEAIVDLDRIASFVDGELFELDAADPRKPHAWITVLVCDQDDFFSLVPILNAGGIYDPDRKHLITKDLGPSLRHEFVHALHWRHMESIGQTHPLWAQEALATLLEDLAPAEGGESQTTIDDDIAIQASWRTNIARRLARSASMTSWDRLFSMPRDRFTGAQARANYAQVRTIADYLLATGNLGAWYRALVAHYDEEPLGFMAFETTFEMPLRDIERGFRIWTRDLPEVAEFSRPGASSLPFRIKPGPVDGMRIDQPVPGALVEPLDPENAGSHRLQRGDVILAIESAPVPTADDYFRALGERRPGDGVVLLIRRGVERFEVRVRLRERDELLDAW
ncbi:MAG: hypothetical protein ACTS3F_08695 [Phycisphaerales bacterium]